MYEELKNCPFCGGEAEIGGKNHFWIVRKDCDSESGLYNTEEETIKFWNRRVTDG